MQYYRFMEVIGIVALLAVLSTPALAETRKAKLDGFQEVPSISTTGAGTFRARINRDETAIDFELTYSGLEGTTVTQAHIHFSREGVNGAIVVFLCGGSKPACPASGTVTGTLTEADIGATAEDQGIAATELGELIEAIRSKAAYVNVHTDLVPSGEIRGQMK